MLFGEQIHCNCTVSSAYNVSFKWLIARKPWCVAQYGMEKTCEWVKETIRYLYQIYKLT